MARPAVLAVCTTALGDTLLCTPALRDLAQVFTVDAVAHRRWVPLLAGNPHLRKVLAYRNNPAARALIGLRLCATHYAKVLFLHANRDALGLLPLLRYGEALGLQGHEDPARRLSSLPRDPNQHFVEQRLALAARAGAPGRDPGPLEVFLTPREHQTAQAWLAARLPGRAPLVWLCPGAALDYKRWPVARFAALAAELARADYRVGVVGAAGEARLAAAVRAACPGAAAALGLPVRLAGALLAEGALTITNDTGPLHLAQAVGGRVLGLFGPSDPRAVGPRDPRHGVLTVPLACSPCRTKACHDPVCLEALPVAAVWQKAQEMLPPATD